ncbi:MAG: aminotransferase class IV [Pirellulaceae bacterium]|nr:aminotransferase class IV [Pirellulaceae bacterium]
MSSRQSVTTMPEPLAYLGGRWLPVSQAAVPITDGGFVQGVTVAEQLRTFGGQLFRLDKHLDRLERSLAIVGVNPGLRREDFEQIATELAAHNHSLLDPADDLGLSIFVTPGPYATFAATAPRRGPLVGMHTYPLPFGSWVEKYRTGESLVVTGVRQVPGDCWPTELKCRSRMHYYLADKAAREREIGARALMLDEQGRVTEASTANILAYFAGEGLFSPPRERILPGVTVAVLEELAGQLGIPFVHRDMTVEDIARADEALLCSTSPCVWSVTQLDGQPLGTGRPGPIVHQLRGAWNKLVGLDIEEQARQFAVRSSALSGQT